MTKHRSFKEAFGRQTPAERPANLLGPATEGRQRAVERFNRRNRLVTKWATPKPFCATPYGERVTLEIFIEPLAAFLAGKPETDNGYRLIGDPVKKPPKWLRPLIADLNDYRKLALMGLSPLMDCMTWDRNDPSADAKLKLRVGEEMEAQLAGTESWDEDRRLRAGAWLTSQVLALDFFDLTDNFPKISARFQPDLDRIREEMIRAHPVHMPVFEPPPPWTGWWMECPGRLRVPFVRRDWWPEHRATIAECLKDSNW